MTLVEFAGVAAARAHMKELLDAAQAGTPTSLRRDANSFTLLDSERLQHFLAGVAPHVEVVAEDGGWSIFLPGTPVAADALTFTEAGEEMIDALREYAQDWVDHLSHAPNHADHWGLVQLVALSSDDQLRGWLTGQPAG